MRGALNYAKLKVASHGPEKKLLYFCVFLNLWRSIMGDSPVIVPAGFLGQPDMVRRLPPRVRSCERCYFLVAGQD